MMEEIFMSNQLNDLIKQYQQGMAMAMIVQLVVYWIMHILKTITDNYRPRAIQQIVFQGVAGGENNKNKTIHYS